MHPVVDHYLQYFYFHHYTVFLRVLRPVCFAHFPGDAIRDCFLYACGQQQVIFKGQHITLADVFSKEAHCPPGQAPPVAEDRKALSIDIENLQQRTYQSGELIRFSLAIFGRANACLPALLTALQQMNLRNAQNRMEPLVLEAVLENHPAQPPRELYRNGKKSKPVLKHPLTLADFCRGIPDRVNGLTLHYRTPVVFDKSGIYTGNYPLNLIVRKTLHRLLALTLLYCETDFDFETAMSDLDRNIRDSDMDCKIQRLALEWEVYELPKKQLISGVRGTVLYQGGTFKYLPVLNILPWVLTGNKTLYGAGKIDAKFWVYN